MCPTFADGQHLDVLRRRLDARLEGASHADRRFVLEAVGAKVIVQADGTWELELQVPREPVEPEANDLQIVNSRPESNYTANTAMSVPAIVWLLVWFPEFGGSNPAQ